MVLHPVAMETVHVAALGDSTAFLVESRIFVAIGMDTLLFPI